MSQGMIDCLHWKGMPLLKTVYDFSLYPMMLWQLKPRTIFELGSGSGASAVWLSDLCKLHDLETPIYSVDLKRPDIEYDNITFLAGDSRDLGSVFTPEMLGAPHPWLVLDDAHADVAGVLKFFHNHLKAGDYVLIEDSPTLLGEVGRFIEQHPQNYKVDTFYTDFFGRNATSANDSILVRL
jgi:cephalosporin hydroxylase